MVAAACGTLKQRYEVSGIIITTLAVSRSADRPWAARREERSVRFVFKRLDFEDHHIFGFIQREFEVADLELMRPMLEQEPAQVAKTR